MVAPVRAVTNMARAVRIAFIATILEIISGSASRAAPPEPFVIMHSGPAPGADVHDHGGGAQSGWPRVASAARISAGTATGRRLSLPTYTCTNRPTAAGDSSSPNSASR